MRNYYYEFAAAADKLMKTVQKRGEIIQFNDDLEVLKSNLGDTHHYVRAGNVSWFKANNRPFEFKGNGDKEEMLIEAIGIIEGGVL